MCHNTKYQHFCDNVYVRVKSWQKKVNDVLEFTTLDVKSQATSSAMPDSGERKKNPSASPLYLLLQVLPAHTCLTALHFTGA